MKESIFNYHFLLYGKKYIFNTNNGGLIEVNPDGFTDEEKRFLAENRFGVEDQCDEVQDLEKEINENINQGNGNLDITVALTYQCNFQCVYCFEDKNNKVMEKNTAQEIIDKIADILSDYKYENLRIHYFGGEPLLNMDVMLYFHENLKKIAENKGIQYKPSLTTNGSMLTDELISSMNFDTIQLTFDGLEKTHNSLRVADTFRFAEQVQLMGRILEHSNTKIRFRVNLCKQNRSEVIKLYRYITGKYGKDRIIFSPNRMIKYHDESQFDMLSVKEYADALIEIKDSISDEYPLPSPERTPCAFVYGNAFSVNTDGNCDFCDAVRGDDNHAFKDVDVRQKGTIRFREECRSCKCLPICLGGCVVQHNLKAGSCTYEKYHMEHIIKNFIDRLSAQTANIHS